jgi:hypothetical protein
MALARTLVLVLEGYLGVGVVFGLLFVSRGVERVDPSAHGCTFGFRVLILPGSTVLWPYLLVKLLRRRRGA